MENNDRLRATMHKKALPRREFVELPVGDGHSEFTYLLDYEVIE